MWTQWKFLVFGNFLLLLLNVLQEQHEHLQCNKNDLQELLELGFRHHLELLRGAQQADDAAGGEVVRVHLARVQELRRGELGRTEGREGSLHCAFPYCGI